MGRASEVEEREGWWLRRRLAVWTIDERVNHELITSGSPMSLIRPGLKLVLGEDSL